jgi:DNA polymerase-4
MRKCAELVFVPPRFEVYRAVSRQIHAIFKDYTPLVEPLSLDEAYLDVTDSLKGTATAWETAKEIRAFIYRETDLTASAGISCNKFLAKLASDCRKPNGQFAILPDEAEAFVASLPVAKFHGVGRRCHVIETTTRSAISARNFKRPPRPRATCSSPRCVARGVIELT